jgi:hypothetical protein
MLRFATTCRHMQGERIKSDLDLLEIVAATLSSGELRRDGSHLAWSMLGSVVWFNCLEVVMPLSIKEVGIAIEQWSAYRVGAGFVEFASEEVRVT